MITGKRSLVAGLILISLILMAGCFGNDQGTIDNYDELLKEDAVSGLRGALAEDYNGLTIIRGSLYKYTMDVRKPQYVGIAIGALQAMVLNGEYEYDRFTRLENITPEVKKEIIAQPLLNIVVKKRDILSHAYSNILDPLVKQLDSGKMATPDQVAVINELVKILDGMVAEYATLSKSGIDYNGREAEDAFFRLQEHHKDLQKLKLPAYRQQDSF